MGLVPLRPQRAPFSPLVLLGQSEKTTVWETRRRTITQDTKIYWWPWAWISRFPELKKQISVVYKPPSLWYFKMLGWNGLSCCEPLFIGVCVDLVLLSLGWIAGSTAAGLYGGYVFRIWNLPTIFSEWLFCLCIPTSNVWAIELSTSPPSFSVVSFILAIVMGMQLPWWLRG